MNDEPLSITEAFFTLFAKEQEDNDEQGIFGVLNLVDPHRFQCILKLYEIYCYDNRNLKMCS